jgi:hypothetical protein
MLRCAVTAAVVEWGRRARVGDGGPTFSRASTNSSWELPLIEPGPSIGVRCVFCGALGSRRTLAYVTVPPEVGTR